MTLDWNALREQKYLLIELIEKDANSPLWGLVNLIDAIQDAAVDEGVPETEVFGDDNAKNVA